jgi:beta-galactosidase
LKLSEIFRNTVGGKETVTVEARLYDANGILCLDARNQTHFTLAGTGKLIDNRGTSRGSRVVEMYNGRAEISLEVNRDGAVVAAHTAGLKTAFLSLS